MDAVQSSPGDSFDDCLVGKPERFKLIERHNPVLLDRKSSHFCIKP